MNKRDLVKYEGKLWRVVDVHDSSVDLDDPKGSGRRKFGVAVAELTLFKSMEADKPRLVPKRSPTVTKWRQPSGGSGGRVQGSLFDDHDDRDQRLSSYTDMGDGVDDFDDESIVSKGPWGVVRDTPLIDEDRFDIHSVEIMLDDNVWWRSGGRILTGAVLGWTAAGVVVELDPALLSAGDIDTAKIPPYRLSVSEHNPPTESMGSSDAGSARGVSKIDTMGLYYGTKVQAKVPSHRGGDGKTLEDGLITGMDINADKVKIHVIGRGSLLIPADDVMSVRNDTGGNWTADKKRTTNYAHPSAGDRYSWLDDMGSHGKKAKQRAKTREKKLRDYISAKDLINDEIKKAKASPPKDRDEGQEVTEPVVPSSFIRKGEW
jgi:hypothetical protein